MSLQSLYAARRYHVLEHNGGKRAYRSLSLLKSIHPAYADLFAWMEANNEAQVRTSTATLSINYQQGEANARN